MISVRNLKQNKSLSSLRSHFTSSIIYKRTKVWAKCVLQSLFLEICIRKRKESTSINYVSYQFWVKQSQQLSSASFVPLATLKIRCLETVNVFSAWCWHQGPTFEQSKCLDIGAKNNNWNVQANHQWKSFPVAIVADMSECLWNMSISW